MFRWREFRNPGEEIISGKGSKERVRKNKWLWEGQFLASGESGKGLLKKVKGGGPLNWAQNGGVPSVPKLKLGKFPNQINKNSGFARIFGKWGEKFFAPSLSPVSKV